MNKRILNILIQRRINNLRHNLHINNINFGVILLVIFTFLFFIMVIFVPKEMASLLFVFPILKYMNLHRAEKEMLILQDDILTEFYHDWLDDDTPLGDSMKPCIEESIAVLTKFIGKRFNLKREKDNGEDER